MELLEELFPSQSKCLKRFSAVGMCLSAAKSDSCDVDSCDVDLELMSDLLPELCPDGDAVSYINTVFSPKGAQIPPDRTVLDFVLASLL